MGLNSSPALSFYQRGLLGLSFLLKIGVLQAPALSTSQRSSQDQGTKCRSADVWRGLSPLMNPTLSLDRKRISSVSILLHWWGLPEWKEKMLGSASNVCSGEARVRVWALLLPMALDSQITLLFQVFDAPADHLF